MKNEKKRSLEARASLELVLKNRCGYNVSISDKEFNQEVLNASKFQKNGCPFCHIETTIHYIVS